MEDLSFFPFASSPSSLQYQQQQHANNNANHHALAVQQDLLSWASLLSGGVGFGIPPLQAQAQTGVVQEQVNDDNNNNNNKAGGGSGNSSSSRHGRTRKTSRPRFAFQTRSVNDILDDGYRWRKYGQKAVKNSIYPRSYYRCTHHTCNVKKQVQRLSKDTSIVVTTYEGIHTHPCEKIMESLSPLLKQMQFFSGF